MLTLVFTHKIQNLEEEPTNQSITPQIVASNPMVGQNVGNGSSVKGGFQRRCEICVFSLERMNVQQKW
nr:hypothetical protein [Tanacetum cinerariifolium]